MKKIYVLDTNVLLNDPDAMFSFEDNEVIIPMVVLEELDRMKSRPDDVGRNARMVSRTLDDLRKTNSLFDGVETRTGGTLKVATIGKQNIEDLPADMQGGTVDNRIIQFMLHLKKEKVEAKLVSKDINVRLKCDALALEAEDYLKMRVTKNTEEFYRGVKVIDDLTPITINSFHKKKKLDLSSVIEADKDEFGELYSNQIIVLKGRQSEHTTTVPSGIARYVTSKKEGHPGYLNAVQDFKKVGKLEPRNKEQNFSLDLLMNPDIRLVTLVGPSGTGKTLLAIASALEQLSGWNSGMEHQGYDKLVVTRPVQTVGKELGFLPGTLEEKMEPWVAPIRDNLNFLIGDERKKRQSRTQSGPPPSKLSLMQDKGLIELEAIAYIRGRSIPNSFIIIDEAQNLSIHELKTIITRVGENTKIVLTGDIEQIDNVHVDAFNNGLTYAIEKFKDQSIAGHVTLLKGERSELATLASQIL
jgi:PhoH-like ATPase